MARAPTVRGSTTARRSNGRYTGDTNAIMGLTGKSVNGRSIPLLVREISSSNVIRLSGAVGASVGALRPGVASNHIRPGADVAGQVSMDAQLD